MLLWRRGGRQKFLSFRDGGVWVVVGFIVCGCGVQGASAPCTPYKGSLVGRQMGLVGACYRGGRVGSDAGGQRQGLSGGDFGLAGLALECLEARVACAGAELFFDAQELVVLGDSL